MATQAKWTFMVYLAGDNDLSNAGDTDLGEMRQVGSSDQVNVVCQFDNAGDEGTRRFRIAKTGSDLLPPALGETDSGDPKVLLEFVQWAVQKYPAERYALVLWNHGGGWEPSEIDQVARSVGAKNFNGREISERSSTRLSKVFFRTSLEQVMRAKTPGERAILSDDGSGHSLDTVELGRVLAQIKKILGQPLDLLGMDACLMSNLEVVYQAQPYARYLVGSEENEPNNGWPYTPILSKLLQQPNLPTAELASHIVDAYIKSYSPGESVTQTAFDLSKVSNLIGPLDQLAATLKDKPNLGLLLEAQKRTRHFWDGTLFDLGQLCQQLIPKTSKSVGKTAQAVVNALTPGAEHFVLASDRKGNLKGCHGVSIYLPGLKDISPYYGDLQFAKKTGWLKMLQAHQT